MAVAVDIRVSAVPQALSPIWSAHDAGFRVCESPKKPLCFNRPVIPVCERKLLKKRVAPSSVGDTRLISDLMLYTESSVQSESRPHADVPARLRDVRPFCEADAARLLSLRCRSASVIQPLRSRIFGSLVTRCSADAAMANWRR
jgi:hypothetical protein